MSGASPMAVRAADAIVAHIAAGDWPSAVVVSRTYTPGGDRTAQSGIIAEVVPLADTLQRGARLGTKEAIDVEARVGIGFQGNVGDPESTSEVDAVLDLAESILATLWGEDLAGMRVMQIDRASMLDWDHLTQAAAVTQAVEITLAGQGVLS